MKLLCKILKRHLWSEWTDAISMGMSQRNIFQTAKQERYCAWCKQFEVRTITRVNTKDYRPVVDRDRQADTIRSEPRLGTTDSRGSSEVRESDPTDRSES